MTTPGSDGAAYVEIVASVEGFERDLERNLKRIAKEQGKTFGERLEKNMLLGFKQQLRADLAKYAAATASAGRAAVKGFDGKKFGALAAKDFLSGFRRQIRADLARFALLGAQAGRATRKGFDGERFGRLSAKDFLRGVKRGLADADVKTNATASLASPSGKSLLDKHERDRIRSEEKLAKALERIAADTARRRAKIDEVAERSIARVRQTFLKAQERDEKEALRRRGDGDGRNNFLAALKSAGGHGEGFDQLLTQKGIIGAGIKLSPLLIPGLASLFQALRNATGALFGIFPAVTGAIGLFALFQGKNAQLVKAMQPVISALDTVRLRLDGIAAAASQGALKNFAKNVVPDLKGGLEGFAAGFGIAFSNVLDSLDKAGFGESLSRALKSVGAAFVTLTNGPGLTGFFRLLLRINEQVSAVLPGLFKRLQTFLNGLNERFKNTDFGALFERGVQAVVDFSAAVVNLLRVLNAFFAAVSGKREQGTFFATLRQQLADLTAFLQRPEVVAGISTFFDAMRRLGAAVVSILVVAFGALKAALSGFIEAAGGAGPALSGITNFFNDIAPKVFATAEFFGKLAGTVVSFLDKAGLLEPLLIGITAGLAAAAVAAAALAVAMLFTGIPEVILIIAAAIGELAAAFTIAKTNAGFLGDVMRTVLSAPLRLAALQILTVVRAVDFFIDRIAALVNTAASLPIIGGQFKGVAAEIAKAQAVSAGLQTTLNGIANGTYDIQLNVKVRDFSTDPLTRSERELGISPKAPTDQVKSTVDSISKQIADALKAIDVATGTSTGNRTAGAGKAAAAAKQAVDLVALTESLTDRLQDALERGGKATSEAYVELRKNIRSTLKGTLQEGKTSATLAFLDSTRARAITAANAYEKISAAVEATRDRLKSLKDEQLQFRQSVLDTLKASASISTFLSNRPGGGVASFTRFLTKDLSKLQQFQTNLSTLLKKGLNATFVRDLASGGLDNARFAKKLAAASPAQIQQINALQAQIDQAAAGTANLTAATFNAGIAKVQATLNLQLVQQKRQEAQLNRLAIGIVNGIAAVIKGKPIPKFSHGGITSGPSIAGEAGRELVVPLQRTARSSEIRDLLALMGRTQPAGPQRSVTIEQQHWHLPPTKADPRAIAREVDRKLAASVR